VKVFATVQIAFGLVGLVLLFFNLPGQGPTLITPADSALATAFGLLVVGAGLLLFRHRSAGISLSILIWSLQTVQVVTTSFTYDVIAGPTLQLGIDAKGIILSLGLGDTVEIGHITYIPPQHKIALNLFAIIVIAYLWRRRGAWLTSTTTASVTPAA
jgi:hypothetical protein